MMKYLAIASCGLCLAAVAQASVFPSSSSSSYGPSRSFGAHGRLSRRKGEMWSSTSSFSSLSIAEERRQAASQIRRNMMNPAGAASAMAIPGYGLGEQIFVGGFQNFLQAYNLIITGRILLSWFPQAQGIGALQPIFAITDPYLNLFRGLIPPIFGLDLSPLLAFFLLNTLGTATTALGADLPHCQVKTSRVWPRRVLQSNRNSFLHGMHRSRSDTSPGRVRRLLLLGSTETNKNISA